MIISKTPYRISFFGGGSDYPTWYDKNDGFVLSTTIDKYIYISCRNLPPFFDHKYRIVWSHIEQVKHLKQIKHKVVKEMLRYFKINNGLEIHYDGDLPARSGMGSSSVFVVGLLNLLTNFKGNKINKDLLAKQSINFEQNILKEVVGSQDQISAAYGGFNKITFKKGGKFNVKKIKINSKRLNDLNNNLLLIYTGLSRNANEIAKEYIHKLQKSKKSNVIEILNFAKEGEKVLKSGNLDDFGRILHESWLVKKDLSSSISNKKIENIYNAAIEKGALGGKLLGAGGGGFILLYVPQNYKKKIINYFNKLITIPFKFSNEGSKIMFKSKSQIK